MKNYVIVAKMMIVFIAVVILTLCLFYRYEIKPMSTNDSEVEITVNAGDTWYTVGANLYEKSLIRSYKFYKIYIKLFRPKNLEAGSYKLKETMTLPEIMEVLEGGATSNEYINITFKEGINMRKVASTIAANTNNTEENVYNLLKDEDYLDSIIEKYWFLTDDIKNKDIYYSLEGYLFPETYNVDKNGSVKEIFASMLDQTDKELTKYKEDIENSKLSIHQILTLASIVELEAGNSTDRAAVAGVFYNRMNTKGETLGSDVTAYYGAKMDDWSNGLGEAETNCNPYNTRLNSKCPINGLPVGPISNPGDESIKAAINPTETKMLFFVADCDGKTYLSKTYREHNNTIAKLKKENKWCDN